MTKPNLEAGAMNQPRGFILEGICLGTKVKENINQQTGEVKKTVYAGIGIPKEDGFDGEIESIQVKVPDSLMQAGYPAQYVQNKQNTIQIQVKINHWQMDKRSGVSYSVVNDKIQVLNKAV